jgi:multicomponent Na+:H+ antiporter subunit G
VTGPLDLLVVALLVAGAFFFLAGTVGLLRFPDVYCRLHALTKADNLGLGLIALGVAVRAEAWTARLQILLVWLLALVAAATVCHLLARISLREGVPAARSRLRTGEPTPRARPS